MGIKNNTNWDEQKKKLHPNLNRLSTDVNKGAEKIAKLAKRRFCQSDAPSTAKENADKFLFALNGLATGDDGSAIRDAIKVVTANAINRNNQIWLPEHGFYYYRNFNNHKEFRSWLIEGVGKIILGQNPTNEDVERIINLIDSDFAKETWDKIYNNYLFKERRRLFKNGKNCFPLRDVVAVVEGGKIQLTSYAKCHAAFRYQIDANYDETAEGRYTRLFLTDFLGATEEEDPAAWARFWELLGYLIVPNQAGKCVIIWYGLGDDGKSTLVWVLKLIILPQGMVNDNDVQNTIDAFGMASCHDKLLAVLHETNRPISGATAELWKKLSGDDGLTVNRKHKDKIPSDGCPKLLITTNHFPAFKPGVLDRALEERLQMIQVFRPKHEKDPELKEKLYAERDYIVTQAILGFARLQANNFEFTKCKKDSDLKELVINGEAACAFLQECADPACLQGPQPGVFTHASVLRERFKNWKRATGEKSTYRDLSATLRIRGFQYGRIRASSDDEFDGFGAQPRVWRGLKLK